MAGDKRPHRPCGPERRFGGLRAVAAPVASVAAPALKKRGLAQGRLLTDWAEIAGSRLADHCRPEKLVPAKGAEGGGTLELRVDGAWALEIQHLAPVLMERINRYFGHAAVGRLRLVHAPLTGAKAAPARTPAPADPAAEAAVDAALAGIEDAALREALAGLGRALLETPADARVKTARR